MSMDTFRKAVAVAADYDSMIAIGGGEPTLQPDLLAMLGIASFLSTEPVFMVTNGTCPERLWNILVEAKRRDRLSLHVSRSPWHDMVKQRPWVRRDADRLDLWWGRMERGAPRTVVMRGRAKRNRARIFKDCRRLGFKAGFPETDCSEPRVSPDGRVWADVPLGGAMGMIDDPAAVARAHDTIQRYEDKENGE